MTLTKKILLLTALSFAGTRIQAQEIQDVKAQNLARQFQSFYPTTQRARELSNQYYIHEGRNQFKTDSILQIWQSLVENYYTRTNELIKANPDSAICIDMSLQYLRLLRGSSPHADVLVLRTPAVIVKKIAEQAQQQFALLPHNIQESPKGQELATYIRKLDIYQEAVSRIKIGNIAPNFTLQDPEGNTFSLHDIKSKIKLVDFWASWCRPCRNENPNMVALYNEFRSQGLEIISVSLDQDRAQWIEAIEEDQLLWEYHGVKLKDGVEIKSLYNVQFIPQTFILDENNKIIAIGLQGEALKQKVAELLR